MKYYLLLGALTIFSCCLRAQSKKVQKCIIENGTLKSIETEYDPATGYYYVTINGTKQLFDKVYPPDGKDYAAFTGWYVNNEKITINGNSYVKYGLPRVLGIDEIEKAGEYQNIGIYIEAGTGNIADIIYIPVRGGCEFQPYQKELEYCKLKVKLNANVATVKAGKDVVLTAVASGSKQKLVYNWTIIEDENYEKDANVRIKGNQNGKSIVVSTKGMKKQLDVVVLVSIEDNDCLPVEAGKIIPVKR